MSLTPSSLGVTPPGLIYVVSIPDPLASNKLAQLKHDAWLIGVDINFMLCRTAPEDAGEIKHGQHHDQTQHNGPDGQSMERLHSPSTTGPELLSLLPIGVSGSP
jgi:hypothetical protein